MHYRAETLLSKMERLLIEDLRCFTLRVKGALDYDWFLSFLAARAIPGLEVVSNREYTRSIRIGNERGATIGISYLNETLTVTVVGSLDKEATEAICTRLFDLGANLGEFLSLADDDRILSPLIVRNPCLRLPVFVDPYEGLVRAILGQQVSLSAARTIGGRLVATFGDLAPAFCGKSFWLFPNPKTLADAPLENIQRVGLTTSKARTIQYSSRLVCEGILDFEALQETKPEVAERILGSIPGVGPWTWAYTRMRALGDRDAFPASDLGVQKALAVILKSKVKPIDKAVLENVSQPWAPWRSYATLHLWNSLKSI